MRRQLDLGGEVDDQYVVEGAADDEGDQSGEEGAQPHIADEIAVDRADRRCRWRPPRRAPTQTGMPKMKKADDRGEAGQREDRADGEIDAAGQHDDGEAGHDDGELAELPRRISEG